MTICLVVQKDTLENGKIKSVLKKIDIDPEEFVSNLQENHCIEYQLLAYAENFSFESKLEEITSEHKTNYGKDWYEFDHNILAEIISLFLKNDTVILNIKSISSIIGFDFHLFPVITKEIYEHKIERNVSEKKVERNLSEHKVSEQKVERNVSEQKVSEQKVSEQKVERNTNQKDQKSIISMLENMQSELPKKERRSRTDKKDKK